MLRQVKKLLAFILALALVFTTFTSDYTSAKVFAEGDTTEEQGNPEEEQGEPENEPEDEGESEDEEESEEEESEDEESEDEESEESEDSEEPEDGEESEDEPEDAESEETDEESEASEEDEEGRIVITYVVDGEGGSVSNAKESFDPDSEEITLDGATATADEGFEFVSWTGGYLEDYTDATLVPDYTKIEENVEFTANFKAVEAEEEEDKDTEEPQDEVTVNGVKISLWAPVGVLPSDAVLKVKTIEESDEVSISEQDVQDAVDAVTTEDVVKTVSFDINIYSEELGDFVQPEDGKVQITFEAVDDDLASEMSSEETDVDVFYVKEDGGEIESVEKMGDTNDSSVEFETDHFSVYSVVITKIGGVTPDFDFNMDLRDMSGNKLFGNRYGKIHFETNDEKIYPADIEKKIDVDRGNYVFDSMYNHEDIGGGKEIEYFFLKEVNGKQTPHYHIKNGDDMQFGGTSSTVYAYYREKGTNKIVIAVYKDGVAPAEPRIYGGEGYTFIGPGKEGGTTVSNIKQYIGVSDTYDTDVVADCGYGSGTYKVYAVAGINDVSSRLSEQFKNDALGYARDYNLLKQGQYIDWYVIKYQCNDHMWHIDGVIRDKKELYLDYDKNTPKGVTVKGLWPAGRKYDVVGKVATATVEGKTAVEKTEEGRAQGFIRCDGYAFLGWSTDKNATSAQYVEGSKITFEQNTTLYAVWEPKDVKYTVAHYLEKAETGKYELGSVEKIGGGIVKNPEEKTGTTAAVPQNYVRTIDGYKHNTAVKADEFFGGVGDKQTKLEPEDVKVLADGSLLINVYYQHSDDKVEFYVLLPDKPIPADGGARPTSDYYPNGSAAAESSGWVGTARLAQGQKWPVYDTNPDRAENIVEKDIISRPTGAINSDKGLQKLYPGVKEEDIVWYVYKHEGNNVSHIDGYIKNQKVEVIYNKNDGTSAPATYTDEEAKTGDYEVLGDGNESVKELMTREGYQFKGWSLKIDAEPGSDDVIKPGTKIQIMTTGTILYAVWSVESYTVRYEYDKVPQGMKDKTPALPDDGQEVKYDYGTQVAVASAVTAPDGYYFTGWKVPKTVTVTDGKFDMPAENVVIKGSFAEKLKVRISLAAPGDNEERLYNGQTQTPNVAIKFDVEDGDVADITAYLEEMKNNAGQSALTALNNLRDMFVITSYAYDSSLDLGADPEAKDIIPSGYVITGYEVVGTPGIDANKDRPGTADEDKKLVGREKDYPIIFNGNNIRIEKDGVDLKDVADITIVDADGKEVTDLSEGITIGYLTIIPREVTLTSGSASRVANGTALTSPAVAISGDGFVAAVKDGSTGDEIDVERLKAEGAVGTITTPCSVPNKIDDIANFKTDFFRADTNYVISEALGTLEVTPVPVPTPSGDDDTPSGGDDTPSGGDGTPTTIPDAPVATAPAPVGAVLGAQREVPVDGPAVLGARRAGTDDTTSRTARAFVVLVSAAVALSLLISGKKKREN